MQDNNSAAISVQEKNSAGIASYLCRIITLQEYSYLCRQENNSAGISVQNTNSAAISAHDNNSVGLAFVVSDLCLQVIWA